MARAVAAVTISRSELTRNSGAPPQTRKGARLPGGEACHNVPHLGQATICSFCCVFRRDFGMSSGWLKTTLLRASLHALHIRAPGLFIASVSLKSELTACANEADCA